MHTPPLILVALFLTGCPATPPQISEVLQPIADVESSRPIQVDPDGAITARVVRILDGDSIAIMVEGKEQIIRLTGVDCPESRGSGGQPYGKRAKQFTSSLCFGRDVRIVQTGKHYDRWLAFVYVEGVFVQHELLRNGLAWHAVKYSNDPDMKMLEDQARANSKGIWSLPSPIDPEAWRKGER